MIDVAGLTSVRDGILKAVGNTPLIPLRRYFPAERFRLFAKVEALNPGGSIKDRPALGILEDAMDSGQVGPGTVIVESTSGNMGIGLAQACCYLGLRLICVVDTKTTLANIRVLRAYGAEIDLVDKPDPESGELLQARLKRVKALVEEIPGAFWPNQYANPSNSASHYRSTMREIAAELDGRIDFVFVATSTCGTVRGCGEYVRDHRLPARVVAVDARGSLIFSDEKAYRRIPGLGAGIKPPLCDLSLIDQVVHVTDLDCVAGCRRLVAREAILAGGSSGAVLAAVEHLEAAIPSGAACVVILPDRGERYLDTIFNDEWVVENFGAVSHLWQGHLWRAPRGAGG
jgi:cysteine synthase A